MKSDSHGIMLPVALACIIKNDAILLLRRTGEPYKNLWSLPGGKIENESADVAIEREVLEETGIRIRDKRLRGVIAESVLSHKNISYCHVIFVYSSEVKGTDYQASDEGILDWFTIDTMETIKDSIIPTDYCIINTILACESCHVYESVVEYRDGIYTLVCFEQKADNFSTELFSNCLRTESASTNETNA